MGISPFYVGQRLPNMTPTVTKDTGGALNLTGATLTGILHNNDTGQDTTMTGTWTITDAANGIAQYVWAAADTATAGNFSIQITATFAGLPEVGDPIPFLILAT